MLKRRRTPLGSLLAGLTLLISFLPGIGEVQAETLYFGPLPMERPEEVIKQFKPMLSFLEQRLGVKTEIRYSGSYAELLERFRTGQIDIAYLGPMPYVSLRDNYPQAEPLVHFVEKEGQAHYTCALFSSGHAIKPGLAKSRFALTQALSTCGYLSVESLLRQRGEKLERHVFSYLGKHDEVVLAVARGEFDFGGAKTSIARSYAHLGIVVLAETPPLPSFALIANTRRMTPERMEQVRKTLIELQPDGRDHALLRSWGRQLRHGAVPASDANYDGVRKLMRQINNIPEESRP